MLLDTAEVNTLPAVVIGVTSVERHPLLTACATITGAVTVLTSATDDPDNSQRNDLASTIEDYLLSPDLSAAITSCYLASFKLTGNERRDGESATMLKINFDAYVAE